MENNNSNIHIYVEHILKVMNENNLKVVVDESPRRSSGLWYKVSVSLLGQYNFKTAHKNTAKNVSGNYEIIHV